MPSGDSSLCIFSTRLGHGFTLVQGDESLDGINAVPTGLKVLVLRHNYYDGVALILTVWLPETFIDELPA